ncbi:GntR family transcriptional regulator [Sporosarcina sp. FSL K6-1522]|uniref:GntR family transcriptional regulator n=1 Tax=Sporosarcina sp. FSL K6-1522 TaxID=2921554 RepID=UPI00315A704D
MLIRIEPSSDIPIYTQLTNQLIELIARGVLADGDALPSVRSLAADLGMNMHTVNKAYHALEKKGIIQIVPKSGAIISPLAQNGILESHRERVVEELKPILAEALVLGMNKEDLLTLASSIISDFKGE